MFLAMSVTSIVILFLFYCALSVLYCVLFGFSFNRSESLQQSVPVVHFLSERLSYRKSIFHECIQRRKQNKKMNILNCSSIRINNTNFLRQLNWWHIFSYESIALFTKKSFTYNFNDGNGFVVVTNVIYRFAPSFMKSLRSY